MAGVSKYTYTTLKQAILDYTEVEDTVFTTTILDGFIMSAEFRINQDLPTDSDRFVQEGTLAANDNTINAPAGTLFVRADNQSLIASGAMNIDKTNNIVSHSADLYPDNFGPSALSEMFLVVNDTLFLTAGNDGNATGGGDVWVTARIRCRVVKLGPKDWTAIAIQSTASQ